MPGRSFNPTIYSYGFNGMESSDEVYGSENEYTSEYRQYDSRLGRWFSPDPKFGLARGWSPYNNNFDNPVYFKDPHGDFVPALLWLFIAATVADASIQASVGYAINPDAGWDAAIAKVDWGDAAITGAVTAMSAGTASEISLGASVNKTILRTIGELELKGEILKATIDWSPMSKDKEDQFKIGFVTKDGNEVAIDLIFNWAGNTANNTILKEFKIATKSDLDVITKRNNMKPVDRLNFKLADDIANSPKTEGGMNIANSYFGEGSSSVGKNEYDGSGVNNGTDPSDMIKQQYNVIEQMNKEIKRSLFNHMYKVLPDATKVASHSVPSFK